MSQSPVTVTYSLEEVLTRLEQKIDKQFEEVNQKLDGLQKDVTDVKVGQDRLEKKVEGLTKRIDSQEFISRGLLISLIVAILGGLAKLFGFVANP